MASVATRPSMVSRQWRCSPRATSNVTSSFSFTVGIQVELSSRQRAGQARRSPLRIDALYCILTHNTGEIWCRLATRVCIVATCPPNGTQVRSPVDLATVTNLEDDNHQAFLFKFANRPIVADAISPKPAFIPRKFLAELARVFGSQNAIPKVIEDAPLSGAVEFGHLLLRREQKLNRPSQVRAPTLPAKLSALCVRGRRCLLGSPRGLPGIGCSLGWRRTSWYGRCLSPTVPI